MTPRRLILICLLQAILYHPVIAQFAGDSLIIYPEEITYNSPFEEEIIISFIKNEKEDYFSLFLCNDQSMTREQAEEFRNVFAETLKNHPSDQYEKMKDKKKVSSIYNDFHYDFLDKYTILVPFSAIFKTKEYHCVTASMLYALIFDEYSIPYEIRIMPMHVYLVAYPKTSYITVETANPTIGTITYNQNFKTNYVEYLREAKLIRSEEYASQSTDQLFEKHFNTTETISLKQLAGLQYRNDAMLALESLDFKKSMIMMEKAWLLNSDTASTYLLFLTWSLNYNQLNKTDPQCAVQLGKLSRFLEKGITTDMIVGEFEQITQKQLFQEGERELYDSSFKVLAGMVRDSTLLAELSFIYNSNIGRFLCIKMDCESSLDYFTKAAQLKPKNIEALDNLFNALSSYIDLEEKDIAVMKVTQTIKEVPGLSEDLKYKQLAMNLYLDLMDRSFYENNAFAGERYRTDFESLYPERNNKYYYLDFFIEKAYSTASLYYFRKGQMSRSREVVEKGLMYVPESYSLKSKLNALK